MSKTLTGTEQVANGFPASLTILKTLCQATLMIACRLNLVLIGQATLNRYRLIRCSSGRIRSRHIQMFSCSHRNFCVCPWLTAVLSTPRRHAGPACHCQCHESAHSVSLEKLSANVDQLCVLSMFKCCCVCRVGCNRPIQCRPNCN